MFLQYGINENGELVYIDQVPRGRTALTCPYCGVPLLARKGEKVIHHLAHDGPTCNPAARNTDLIGLPAYEQFNLDVPGKVVEDLMRWPHSLRRDGLERHDLIKEGWKGKWDLTHKGKLIRGELSLDLFNKLQKPLIQERHTELERQAAAALGTVDADVALTDLRLYRAQWRRILTTTLYFLEVRHSGGSLWKIGVTTRPIEERITEIRADLIPHFGATLTIRALDTWERRGNVELYFKYRYKAHQTPLGTLTEYYTFEDVKPVLLDLRRMKPDELTPLEEAILRGERSAVELDYEAAQIEARRRVSISAGMKQAYAEGRAGKPRGPSPATVLKKPYTDFIRWALEQGHSLRKVADLADVAVNTVRKVQQAAADLPPYSSAPFILPGDFHSLYKEDPAEVYAACRQAYAARWGREWRWPGELDRFSLTARGDDPYLNMRFPQSQALHIWCVCANTRRDVTVEYIQSLKILVEGLTAILDGKIIFYGTARRMEAECLIYKVGFDEWKLTALGEAYLKRYGDGKKAPDALPGHD